MNDNYGPGYTGIGLVKYEEFRHRGGGKKAADIAITNLKKAIRLEEFPVTALNLLGCVLRHKKDYEGSIKLLEYAERMDPNWVGTYINLTSVLRDMEEVDMAISVLERGVDKNPESQRLHGRLGAFLYLDGQNRRAYDELNKAIQIDQKDGLSRFHLALTLLAMGKEEEADREYERVQELILEDPNNMSRISVPKYDYRVRQSSWSEEDLRIQ